jgi:hypothetical protein
MLLPLPPLPHVVVKANAIVMLFELDPLDTFGVGSGNGSVHFFSRGKTRVGCIDACGSSETSKTSKTLATATPPSRKVVLDPNLID